ncbi:MAG TPA: Uma2 family endonuclease [Jiangellaceae bacterium]|nr:Uma2 family endonuclease [Jiangellaceae bacterium]
MSTATVDHGWDWDSLYAAWRQLDVPDGWRAEITEEGITVTPPPMVPHVHVASIIHRTLNAALPADVLVLQAPGVAFSHLTRLYEPDLIVVPHAAVAGAEYTIPAERALLVVEITSRSNARQDRTAKKWAYGHGPVPLYLLVDPWAADGPVTTLYADPVDGEYRSAQQIAFGGVIVLPAPFDIEIDSADFPRP